MRLAWFGQGVLRECLLEPDVEAIQSIGRRRVRLPVPAPSSKFDDGVHENRFDLQPIESDLSGFDACFFCLGTSSVGISAAEYERLTFDLTLTIAKTLVRLNSAMTFAYVSGMERTARNVGGQDGPRVKGKTENALLALPFKAAYMFRPGIILSLHGANSKTRLYRLLYAAGRPLWPVLRRLFPNSVLTTEEVGLAMLRCARHFS